MHYILVLKVYSKFFGKKLSTTCHTEFILNSLGNCSDQQWQLISLIQKKNKLLMFMTGGSFTT